MARSLGLAGAQPEGVFDHAASSTHFESRPSADGLWQSFERPGGVSGRLRVEYAIGSGSHAVGFLAVVGNHLFQSPLSYYTNTSKWDVAPGYEEAADPDFSRPVTVECLNCHADKPLPLSDSLNSYQSPPFDGLSIQCGRCHGAAEAHLHNPVRGSIINPAKLAPAERDSVCEQCHLAGQIRIPNRGRTIADFKPGERTEDVFTVYVSAAAPGREVKVISHSEQLALSVCARQSAGKLWCGTCHDPHQKPADPVAYYRARCLSCHSETTLTPVHTSANQDCIPCHMPKRPAKDGGHTAFTDHRIARRAAPELALTEVADLKAWREPATAAARDRNLAIALVTEGIQNSVPDQVIRGFRLLNRMDLHDDAAGLTVLGSVFLTAGEAREAERRFTRALALRPGYAPYEVNVGDALVRQSDFSSAKKHLERALELDPLLPQAVRLLQQVYEAEGDIAKAGELREHYRHAMGVTVKSAAKP